jgi:tripartite-type tricarboxylate transporter receptor subunit TctC
VIENRPGGNSNIGTEAVVRFRSDGYTLLLITPANAINGGADALRKAQFQFHSRHRTRRRRYPGRPTSRWYHPSFPAKTVPEFIAYAKANPGKITFASGGSGNPSRLTGELLKIVAGIDIVHRPLSRSGARSDRSTWRAGTGHVRYRAGIHRILLRETADCARWR